MAPRWRPTLPHAGFGGRLRGKGPHPHRERDLAAQPTLLWRLPHRLIRRAGAHPPTVRFPGRALEICWPFGLNIGMRVCHDGYNQ